MPTLMQKIRLAFRGWQRRREDQEKEFVQRNASWGTSVSQPAATMPSKARSFEVDTEGLTVAYLDDSGVLAHFLDTEDGEIVDVRVSELTARADLRLPRFRRIPSRDSTSDAEDRRAFVATLDASAASASLARSVDADAFRAALAADRSIERAWYNFRNDRAIAIIEAWLETF